MDVLSADRSGSLQPRSSVTDGTTLRSAAGLLALQEFDGIGQSGALHFAMLATEIQPIEAPYEEAWSRALAEVEAEIESCRAEGIRVISIFDADYPERLRAIPDPPPVLYVKGDLEALHGERVVTVAGSREARRPALAVTEGIVEVVGASGWTIVAGLGKGVDTAVHRAALKIGAKTIAVNPAGLGHNLPGPRRQLVEEIVEAGGVLVSPYRMAWKGSRMSSMGANRTSTALAKALILTAAPDDDGVMYIVADAAGQGRTVMVADLGGDGDGEGLRTLLSSPANQLHERLKAWKWSKDLTERLGEEPLAERISPDQPQDLPAALDRVPETAPGSFTPWSRLRETG